MKGQMMSFDLLVSLVLLTLCFGVVVSSTDVLIKNYNVEQMAQLNKAQLIADRIVYNCDYSPTLECVGDVVGDVDAFWRACGLSYGSDPLCDNKQVGRRFVKCGTTEVGELMVVTCA